MWPITDRSLRVCDASRRLLWTFNVIDEDTPEGVSRRGDGAAMRDVAQFISCVVGVAVLALLGVPEHPTPVLVPPMAAEVAPSGPTLVFATFNVCKTDCAPPAPSWDVRRDRVARTIVESGIDIVGLQEVTHQPTTSAKTQYLDLQALTAPFGYIAPSYTSESDHCRWTADNPHPCTHTTGLLFSTRTVEQVSLPGGLASAGTVSMAEIASGLTVEAAQRKVVWAYLRGLNGFGPFLALSVHTSTLKDPANEASRVAFGSALDAWVRALDAAHGMSGAPTVLMADLNSYAKRQPRGVQEVLTRAGWLDAASAPVRRNIEYSTINYNPLLSVNEQGFPVRPYRFRVPRTKSGPTATRIDYIFTSAGLKALDYEVVIRLNANGTFEPDYQGSDHQLVRATIEYEGPVA